MPVDSMKEITLTQGKVALVDDEDFEALNARKWCALRIGYTFYAKRSVRREDGIKATEYMHRVVLSRKLGRMLVRGERPDHEHGNGLDNRREEIRLATPSQNNHNCRRHRENPSSRFLGVSWHSVTRKWLAQIRVNGKRVYLGIHTTETLAALAREAYITARPELMARSNFSQQEGPS